MVHSEAADEGNYSLVQPAEGNPLSFADEVSVPQDGYQCLQLAEDLVYVLQILGDRHILQASEVIRGSVVQPEVAPAPMGQRGTDTLEVSQEATPQWVHDEDLKPCFQGHEKAIKIKV